MAEDYSTLIKVEIEEHIGKIKKPDPFDNTTLVWVDEPYNQYRVFAIDTRPGNKGAKLWVGIIGKHEIPQPRFCPLPSLYKFHESCRKWIAEQACALHGNADPNFIDVPPPISE